eukprot:Selendium_serpulae@DN5678_c0_g1_i2.p1
MMHIIALTLFLANLRFGQCGDFGDFVSKATCVEHIESLQTVVDLDNACPEETVSPLWQELQEVIFPDIGTSERQCRNSTTQTFNGVDISKACFLISLYAESCDCQNPTCFLDQKVANFTALEHPQCRPVLWKYCSDFAKAHIRRCEEARAALWEILELDPAKNPGYQCNLGCSGAANRAVHSALLLIALLAAHINL